MAQASQSRPNRGAGVKALLALGVALWAVPAQAQEQIVCGPAAAVREFLEGEGLKKTGFAEMADGDKMEVWESEHRIAVTILIPDPKDPARCLIRVFGVSRKGRGA